MASFLSFKAVSSACLACTVLGVSVMVLHHQSEPGLAAATNSNRTDQDGDGLSDQQELILGTLTFRADSDRDSYSDFEEVARGSEPMNATSLPEDAPYGIGSCASEEDGYVRMLLTIHTAPDELSNLRLVLGVVYNGRIIRIEPGEFRYQNGFLPPGRDATSRLAGMELGLTSRLVRRLGRVHLFAVLGSTRPGSERLVTTLSLASMGGVITSIQQRRVGLTPSGGAGGTQGVVYRPLGGDESVTAGGWEAGQICFQRTSAVGSNGGSIEYEVNGADSIPMDTQCNPGECSSGVGTSLDLPDPAALIGG
jgi:hypothetical protein